MPLRSLKRLSGVSGRRLIHTGQPQQQQSNVYESLRNIMATEQALALALPKVLSLLCERGGVTEAQAWSATGELR
jgi:hypothetical protein